MIFAVSLANLGRGIGILVLIVLLAIAAIGALRGGYEAMREGGGFGFIFGLIFVVLGIGAGAMAVGSFAIIGNVLNHVDKTRNYQERILVIRNPATTIEGICIRYRPTWSIKDCQARIHEHNRAVDLQRLQPGDKLYLDINIGHSDGGQGDVRSTIDYKKSIVRLNRQFPTLAALCDRYRPTWRHPYCEQRIRDYNNLPKLGKLKLGTAVELPVTI